MHDSTHTDSIKVTPRDSSSLHDSRRQNRLPSLFDVARVRGELFTFLCHTLGEPGALQYQRTMVLGPFVSNDGRSFTDLVACCFAWFVRLMITTLIVLTRERGCLFVTPS